MEWVQLAGNCDGIRDCPHIWLTQEGTIAVQGTLRGDGRPPTGEAIVEVPFEMLMEVARALATG